MTFASAGMSGSVAAAAGKLGHVMSDVHVPLDSVMLTFRQRLPPVERLGWPYWMFGYVRMVTVV